MSAGIPVIASNFELWRPIVEGGECGICVDPKSPREIADAINELASNPERAKRLGENGRRMIDEKLNWHVEESKLLELYKTVLDGGRVS